MTIGSSEESLGKFTVYYFGKTQGTSSKEPGVLFISGTLSLEIEGEAMTLFCAKNLKMRSRMF